MFDTIIMSGGNIQDGFALGFLKKRIKESGRESLKLVAADKGMEWFMRNPEILLWEILTVFLKKGKPI